MINKNYTKLIEAHHEGVLTGADEKLFKQLIKEDVDFRLEVEIYDQLYTGLGGLHLDFMQENMDKWEADQSKKETPIISIAPFRKYLAIAAAIALLLSVPLVYHSLNSVDPFEQHFHASSSLGIHTGSVRNSENRAAHEYLKGKAFTAYQKGDYTNAIKELTVYTNKFEEQAKDDSQAFLILAVSQIAVGDYTNAITNLEKVMETQDAVDNVEEAEWMWALAQYKIGNVAAAKELLHKIVKNIRHDRYNDAKDFLSDL